MRAMRLTQVDQCQHHENECLQRDYQNVKQRPNSASDHVAQRQQHTRQRKCRCTTHQGNQHEHQLAGVHIAEQPHPQTDRLGQVFDQVQEQVRNRQHDFGDSAFGVERRGEQLFGKAPTALGFDRVINDQLKNGD